MLLAVAVQGRALVRRRTKKVPSWSPCVMMFWPEKKDSICVAVSSSLRIWSLISGKLSMRVRACEIPPLR